MHPPKRTQTIGQGVPVLWLHGFGFDKGIWRTLATQLQDHICSYLIDLPGFGEGPEMGWQAFKDVILAELPEQFSVLGWSLGGLYATRLAIEAPARVQRLVNVASSPCFIKEKGWPGIPGPQFLGFYEKLIQAPEQAMQAFIQSYGTGLSAAENMAGTYRLSALLSALEILKSWDLRSPLAELNCAAFYIFGSHDSIIPQALYRTMKKSHPRFRYWLIDNAGHAPFMSHPALFIHELKQFLL